MKRTSKKQIVEDIDSKIAALWRMVDELMAEADQKTAHMKLLRTHDQVPLLMGDSPANCWQRICEHYKAIGELRDLRSRIEIAASTRRYHASQQGKRPS